MKKPPANAALLNRVMSAYYMESQEYGLDLRTEAGWRSLRARYWGNIALVDRSVNMILRALAESGQMDNTIIVFTSDHGEMMGNHGILGKTVMYEEAVRVPLLIQAPGVEAGQIPGNFSHIDLLPTVLDLMGEAIPDHVQGHSRAPVLRGDTTLAGNDIFIEWNGADGHPLPWGSRGQSGHAHPLAHGDLGGSLETEPERARPV